MRKTIDYLQQQKITEYIKLLNYFLLFYFQIHVLYNFSITIDDSQKMKKRHKKGFLRKKISRSFET